MKNQICWGVLQPKITGFLFFPFDEAFYDNDSSCTNDKYLLSNVLLDNLHVRENILLHENCYDKENLLSLIDSSEVILITKLERITMKSPL